MQATYNLFASGLFIHHLRLSNNRILFDFLKLIEMKKCHQNIKPHTFLSLRLPTISGVLILEQHSVLYIGQNLPRSQVFSFVTYSSSETWLKSSINSFLFVFLEGTRFANSPHLSQKFHHFFVSSDTLLAFVSFVVAAAEVSPAADVEGSTPSSSSSLFFFK